MESTLLRSCLRSSFSSLAQSKLQCSSRESAQHGGWPIFSDAYTHQLKVNEKFSRYSTCRNVTVISCAKTAEPTVTAKAHNHSASQQSKEYRIQQHLTLPNVVEALILEMCDETKVAELKLKVGEFEMHLKRNIGAKQDPSPPNVSPKVAPPIPSEPMNESASVGQTPPQATSPAEKISPFINTSFGKPAKLASLEASASNNYVLISSPTVGMFRRNRTIKGKKQPPLCKEGDIIKEGQVVGYLDQFGTQLPVKSDVDGEVLKLLFDDGDAVGYGDPLVAVLPSFHDIQ